MAKIQLELGLLKTLPQKVNLGFADLGTVRLLNIEDVAHLAVITLGPKLGFVGHIDQLDADANAVTGAADAAVQNVRHLQLFTNFRDGVFASTKREGGGACGHPEAGNLGEGVQDFFGKAIAEVLVIFVGRLELSPGLKSARPK